METTALTPERVSELVQRAGDGVPKAVLARDYGISRETVYRYLRHAKLEWRRYGKLLGDVW